MVHQSIFLLLHFADTSLRSCESSFSIRTMLGILLIIIESLNAKFSLEGLLEGLQQFYTLWWTSRINLLILLFFNIWCRLENFFLNQKLSCQSLLELFHYSFLLGHFLVIGTTLFCSTCQDSVILLSTIFIFQHFNHVFLFLILWNLRYATTIITFFFLLAG